MTPGAHLVQFGEVGDLHEVRQATGVDDGRADVVDQLLLDQLMTVEDRVEHLAHGQRRRGVPPDETERRPVLRQGPDPPARRGDAARGSCRGERPRSASADDARRAAGGRRGQTPCAGVRTATARTRGSARCSTRAQTAGHVPPVRTAASLWALRTCSPTRERRSARGPQRTPPRCDAPPPPRCRPTSVPFAWPYTMTASRDAPPSSWYTGTPSDLPLMSQRAMSTARDRGHGHGTAPPVRALVQVLPGILDTTRVASDEQRHDVLGR